jgi:transcriptional regulator with XRE-family HTH domain
MTQNQTHHTPLAELIRNHCDRTGDTLADIAERGDVSRQTLSALVNKTRLEQLPRAATVRKLAKGLGLPYDVVRRVATESTYGEDDSQLRRSVRVLVAYAERMPDSQVEVLLATARALEMTTTQGPDDHDDEPPVPTRAKSKARKASEGALSVIR